jgi:hypothetical protein
VPGGFVAEFAPAQRERYVVLVEAETHARGWADTTRRRLAKLVVVSALLHVPLTPWAALAGLLHLIPLHQEPVSDAPQITAIPVDILSEPGTQAPAQPPEPSEPALGGAPARPVVVHPKKKSRAAGRRQ